MDIFGGQKNIALLVTDRKQRQYFSGVDIAEGFLFVGNGRKDYFTDSRYYLALKEKLQYTGVFVWKYNGLSDLKSFIFENKFVKLLIDYGKTTISEYEEYKEFGIEIADGKRLIEGLRSVKNKDELHYISRACEIIQTALQKTVKHVKAGITEIQLKDVLENYVKELGGDGMSFETIVAFGKNSAVPHHETSDKELENDSVILIDCGAVVNGYCSDLTRTFFFGKPSEKFVADYNAVLKANEKAEAEIESEMYTDEADGIARTLLKEYGLKDKFTHSLGHGVGLDIHEFPYLSPKKHDKLVDNNVFSIEPGVYFDGEYGIRIEDTVVLLDKKVKRLFTDDKKLIIIK